MHTHITSASPPFARWFGWAVFLGILQDWAVGLPGIFVPNAVLKVAKADRAAQPVWPAFASLLLVLLSLFYIPGALDPYRFRPNAILAVAARAAGVVFFLGIWRGRTPAWFGYLDLTFTALQGSLLWLTLKRRETTQ